MHWTASVNVYDSGEEISYSIGLWRVGQERRTRPTADLKWHGKTARPIVESPHEWLRTVLQEIQKTL